MAIKKCEYMIITPDYDLMKKVKEILDASQASWKVITSYYNELNKLVKRVSEESVTGR